MVESPPSNLKVFGLALSSDLRGYGETTTGSITLIYFDERHWQDHNKPHGLERPKKIPRRSVDKLRLRKDACALNARSQ